MWFSYNIQKSSFIWYIYFRVIFSQRNIGLPDVKMVGPRLSYATDRYPSSILFDFYKNEISFKHQVFKHQSIHCIMLNYSVSRIWTICYHKIKFKEINISTSFMIWFNKTSYFCWSYSTMIHRRCTKLVM